jgi:hypothetical protein
LDRRQNVVGLSRLKEVYIYIFNRQKDINRIFKNLQNIPVCIKIKNQKIPHLQTLIVGNSLLNMLRVLFLSSLVSQLKDQLCVTDDVSVCGIVAYQLCVTDDVSVCDIVTDQLWVTDNVSVCDIVTDQLCVTDDVSVCDIVLFLIPS